MVLCHTSSVSYFKFTNFFKCVQTIPTGSPPVLTPSLHKQDIEQIRKDLPKYDDTGVFTPEVKKEWEDFLGTFNDRFGKVPFEEPPWVLDEIRENKIR